MRELEALREMTFSLIAERRRHAPRGAAGGLPGARGRDLLDGRPLPGKATGTLRAGQRLRIETPGGGGFGRPGRGAQASLNSFFSEICLLEQQYQKDPSRKIKDLVADAVAQLKENILVSRFVRFEVGQSPTVDVTAGEE